MPGPVGEGDDALASCVVSLLGYPGTGKRTVGGRLAERLDGVLVGNALINRPVLELLRWDGVRPLPPGVWDSVAPIRETVVRAIEELAPPSTSYVFTDAHLRPGRAGQPHRHPGPVALRKGSDPEGDRAYTRSVALFQPPADEVLHLDTTATAPDENARLILEELRRRGLTAGRP